MGLATSKAKKEPELRTAPPSKPHMQPYGGYYANRVPEHDPKLTETGPGTPMGEYMRRFWHPVCLSAELTDTPHFLKILSEELVAFRDKSGRVGLLHAHCVHRGASLEYGRIEERGIRLQPALLSVDSGPVRYRRIMDALLAAD